MLIGSCAHWRKENRPAAYLNLSPLHVEIKILREAGWKNWGGKSWAGKSYHRHLLALIKLMLPKTDIQPTLADAVSIFCQCVSSGKKGMHMLGSQNCSKSGSSARIALAIMAVFPKESAIYFANPFDSASDSTIWGEVEECYDECKESCPGLFPDSVKYALKKIDLVPGIPKAGTMEIRNVKHAGKFKGTKTLKTGEVEGLILLIIDEVNEIYNYAFLKILSNLASQDGFFTLTSQNFKDPYDMGGQLAEPKDLYGGPNAYTELTKETDFLWDSYGGSVTVRFSGLDSPNIRADRTIYPYLFTHDNLKFLIDTYGESSPEFYSQCLSFPMDDVDSNSVLSKSRINASRHDDPYYTVTGPLTRVAFCDPAFGGGDRAVYCYMEFGEITYLDHHGGRHTSVSLIAKNMVSLNIVKELIINDEMRTRILKAGGDPSKFESGSHLSPDDQIALYCKEFLVDSGIESRNFGYDFSMRPDIIMSMTNIVGPDSVPFDYNTKPVGHYIKSLKASSEDCCRMKSDELAFITSDVFANQRIRQGGLFATAILQLSRSRYEIRHGKRIMEKKIVYKGRWNNQSPDERDTFIGCVGMAYRAGFKVEQMDRDVRRSPWAPALPGSNPNRKSLNKFRRKTGARLKY